MNIEQYIERVYNKMKQYYDDGPTLDDEAKSHGYADYADYRDEYYQGHTGGELGEPF